MLKIYSYKNGYHTPLLIASLLLSGCGGESEGEKNEEYKAESTQQVDLFAQDSIHYVATGESVTIDLSSSNTTSSESALYLNEIVNLGTEPSCEPVNIEGMSFILEKFDKPMVCKYKYDVTDGNNVYSSDRMVSHVISRNVPLVVQNSKSFILSQKTSDVSVLPIVRTSVSDTGSSININLEALLGAKYPQDENKKKYILTEDVLVLGKGSAVVNKESNVIKYNSDKYDRGGVTRLLYTLTSDFEQNGQGNYEVGAIDISVSGVRGGNSTPIAKDFIWDNNSEEIKLGVEYQIDVASNKSEDCTYDYDQDKKVGSCIFDENTLDSLQLVGTYSYDADVRPTYLFDLSNTKLSATFKRTGMHDIVYQVSDHYGGFAIGVIRVNIPSADDNLPPVIKDNPLIIYMNENETVYSSTISSLASDPEGNNLDFKELPIIESDLVIASIVDVDNSKAIKFTSKVGANGVYKLKTRITDGVNTVEQYIIIVINSSSRLTLKSGRSFDVEVGKTVSIDVGKLIDNLVDGETVSIKSVSGNLFGELAIDDENHALVKYTASGKFIGKDDFIFEVETSKGAKIAGDITLNIGNPPELDIESINATEGENSLISAIVECNNCDVSRYEYTWQIRGKIVSTSKSFTITPEQRLNDVTLIVRGYDVFNQSVVSSGIFRFFAVDFGTFENPAESCQEIFWHFNSPYALVAEDGEYWLTSADHTKKFKTQCDMVSEPEAEYTGKTVGGYTLVWSYSERSSFERLYEDPDSPPEPELAPKFHQNGKKANFLDGSVWGNGMNLVEDMSGSTRVRYNAFRIPDTKLRSNFSDAIVRVSYTSDPFLDSIDKDADGMVQNWFMESTLPMSIYAGGTEEDPKNLQTGFFGKLGGSNITLTPNELVSGGISNSGPQPPTHIAMINGVPSHLSLQHSDDGIFFKTKDLLIKEKGVSTLWGNFGGAEHEGAQPIGRCYKPVEILVSGYKALGCDGSQGGKKTYHNTFNYGEGAVVQWWAKETGYN